MTGIILTLHGRVNFAPSFLESDDVNPTRIEIPFMLEGYALNGEKDPTLTSGTAEARAVEYIRRERVIHLPSRRELPIKRGDLVVASYERNEERIGYDIKSVEVLDGQRTREQYFA